MATMNDYSSDCDIVFFTGNWQRQDILCLSKLRIISCSCDSQLFDKSLPYQRNLLVLWIEVMYLKTKTIGQIIRTTNERQQIPIK